jgi:hypothetical protein
MYCSVRKENKLINCSHDLKSSGNFANRGILRGSEFHTAHCYVVGRTHTCDLRGDKTTQSDKQRNINQPQPVT